jgi:prevent-host-death family protein
MTTLEVFMRKSTVGSRELKTRLGTYLRKVQQGETLVITERGRPIAELKPISVETSGDQRKIDELVALGMLTRQSGDPLERVKPVRLRGKPLSATILEDREDRF